MPIAYEKTWMFDANRANRDNVSTQKIGAGYFAWYMKAALCGQGGFINTGTTPPIITTYAAAAGGALTAGTYFYRVTALIGAVESPGSNEVQVTTSGGNLTANITWGAVAGATSYKLYRSTATGTELLLATITAPTVTYADAAVGSPSGAIPNNGFWWVVASCNGTGTASATGTDYWTGTYDPAVLVFGTNIATSNRSWVLLRSPLLPSQGAGAYFVYMLICLPGVGQTGTAWNGELTISYSKALPTGLTNTTLNPVFATDSFPASTAQFASGFTPGYGTVPVFGSNATLDLNYPHMFASALTTDGSAFYFLSWRVGYGRVETGILFSQLSNCKTVDQYPFYQIQSFDQTASQGCFDYQWIGKTYINNYNPCSAARLWNGTFYSMNAAIFIPAIVTSQITTWDVTNYGISFQDIQDSTWPDWPCWVGCTNNGANTLPFGGFAIKGRLADFSIGCGRAGCAPQGAPDASTGVTSAIVGYLYVPTNTGFTLL